MKKFNGIKIFKHLLLLSVVGFAVYLNHLDNRLKEAFAKPLDSTYSTITFKEYPKKLTSMLLAVEDQSFFQHSGVDFVEIARVLRDYWWLDKPIRGASTLTQQLIKNTVLTRERTVQRKINEALMALLLEAAFDKNFILSRYMNTVYLAQRGHQAIYGFANAAQFYFHKPIHTLSAEEMATLVALIKGPSYYHPVKHAKRLAQRRQLVLLLNNTFEKIVK